MASKKLSEKLPQPGEFIVTKKAEYEVIVGSVPCANMKHFKVSNHFNLTSIYIQHPESFHF